MESSSGSSPGNSKKSTNIEIMNFASTDEILKNFTANKKNYETPDIQHEKRKQSPSFSSDNSPNSFQNPRLKSKIDEIGKNDNPNKIPENLEKIKNFQQILKSQGTT